MKKVLFTILITLSIFALSMVMSACFAVIDEGKYSIDGEEFNSTLTYKGEFSYDGLYVVRTDGETVTRTPINVNMLLQGIDTSTVGTKAIVLIQGSQKLAYEYTVKYRVSFVAGGEEFASQHVLESSEITFPTPIEREGYEFSHWSEIPTVINDNITLEAHYYDLALTPPELPTLSAVYGDSLSTLTLPENSLGEWEFVDDLSTSVGNAGRNEFDVRFVPAQPNVKPWTDKVTVSVAKKKIEFSSVMESLVYDGKEKYPTYSLPVDVDVIEMGERGVNVGEYNFALTISDDNYEGSYVGSYEIEKAEVRIKVNDQTITYGESVPDITYEIYGFEDVDLLGVQAVKPNVINVGEYPLTVTVNNDNIILTVEKGVLRVEKADYDATRPTLSTEAGENGESATPAVFGDRLDTVKFIGKYVGEWKWKNPDLIIDDMSGFTAIAIFTPQSSNYNPVEMEITVTNISKRGLVIEVVENEYVYEPNAERTIEYILREKDGSRTYEGLTVLGNVTQTNAGVYSAFLSIDDERYSGELATSLIINKAIPEVAFDQTFTVVWEPFITLEKIPLSDGFTWIDDETGLDEIGSKKFGVIFTPQDTANYETVTGEFEVTVQRADARLENVKAEYGKTYDGEKYVLVGVSASHTEEATVAYSYFDVNGEQVDEIINAGEYTVLISLSQSTHYNSATAVTTVVINKADNVDTVIVKQSAVYGDTLSVLTLPISDIGEWSWQDGEGNELSASSPVGNAGERTIYAVFTPNSENYNARAVAVTLTINKQKVSAPVLSESEFVYNGGEQLPTVDESELYSVTYPTESVNAGSYAVTVTLRNANNYEWTGVDGSTVTLNYTIKQAVNEWTETPSITDVWTYGEAGDSGSASAKFGEVIITYSLYGSGVYTSELPTDAGSYVAKFSVSETDNYTALDDTIAFIITPAPATDSDFTATYTVEWFEGITLSDITLPDGYAWTDEDTSLEVGEGKYEAVYTPSDTNYSAVSGEFTVVVEKKTLTIIVTESTFTYDGSAKKVEFTVTDGVTDYTSAVTVTGNTEQINAGEYEITLTVEEANYDGSVSVTLVIEKADVSADLPEIWAVYEDLLSAYPLPEFEYGSWTWADGEATVGEVGERTHKAIFTPTSNNYNDNETLVTVNVSPKTLTIIVTNYTFTYDESAKKVEFAVTDGVSDYTSAVTVTGNTEQINAGEYAITLTLDETNYTASPVTTYLVIEKASYSPALPIGLTATYGDRLSSVALPTSEIGTWAWVSASSSVGNAGERTHKATFTHDNDNYLVAEIILTVTVEKQTVTTPTSPDSQTYTGSELSIAVNETAHYNALTISGTNAGDYTGTLTLKDATNYKWDSAGGVVTFTITKADNSISGLTISGWTYGNAPNTPSASADFGEIEYTYYDEGNNVVTPVSAGTYTVKATVAGTDNYASAEATTTLVIEKATVTTPTVESKDYTGETLTADVPTSDLYTVMTNNGGVNAGTYTVTLTLTDSDNYKWDNNGGVVTFTITKADNSISGLTISGWTYGNAPNTPSASADFGEIEYTYYDEENNEVTPVSAGTYTVKATVAGTDNYASAEATETFIIEKATVTTPTVESKDYTGETLTADVPTSDLYTVTTNNGGVNAGTYTVTLTLTDSDNYKWDNNGGVVTFTITKADNSITDLTISGWIYGETAKTPSASADFGEIEYTYYDEENNEVTPTSAGTYTVKASVVGTDNYASAEATTTLVIEKQTVTTPTSPDSQTYTGSELSIAVNETAHYNALTISGTNAGDYTETLTLKDTTNYKWDNNGGVVTFTITKADNSISGLTISGWIYGETAKTPSASADFGEIEYTYYDEGNNEVTPVSAGTYTVKATVSGTDNYASAEATTTLVIEKQTVTTPTSPDSQTYTGSELSIAVSETDLYNALTISGTNAGDYTGTLTLTDSDNYKWDSANGVVTFTITKADNSISGLTISGWTYGETAKTPSASADFGEIEYTYYDEENNEVTPVSAGTYTVKATVAGTDNYASAEATTTLVIEKQTVTTPTVESKDYTGETLTADVPTSDLYTVTTNNGGVNAGTYTVTLTLTDSDNYKWDSANGVTSFTIDKATPTVTASISGWTYDSATSEPTHNTDDYVTSNVWYEYSTFAESGFSATKPTKAGTYYVIAKVTGTDNYHGATSSAVQFTIAKAQISVPELSYTSVSYNGSAQKPTVANGKYAVIYESENSVNVDEYTVTLSLTDTDNYEWSDGTTDDKDLTYSITKADNAITVSMVGWTYGNTPNSPSATATFGTEFTYAYSSSADGEYSSALPTNAGTYYVKASVVETDNYAGATSNAVAFTIEKKAITPPTIAGKEYTGELLTADVPTSADYTVIENNGGIDKGSYNVVLTLTSDNYKWAGHTDEERFVTLTFTIAGATNYWETEPTIAPSWTYGEAGDSGSASAKFGTVIIEYKKAGSSGSYSTSLPSTAGSYTVRFTVSATEDYTALSQTLNFEILQAVVDTPTSPDSQIYTGEELSIAVSETDLYNALTISGTNAGDYTGTLTLKDATNYKWDNNGGVVTFTITKADNSISGLTINGWTYGNAPNTPSASADFGEIEYTYYDEENNEVTPVSAGTYTVKASVVGTDNYASAEATTTLVIEKQTVTTPTSPDSQTYTGSELSIAVNETAHYNALTISGTNAGDYTGTLTLKDATNYKWDSANGVVTFTITKADNSISGLTISGWTYGNAPNTPSASADFGEIEYTYYDEGNNEVTPVSAGTYTVKASVVGTDNYASAEATTTLVIEKATVTTPTSPDSQTYTGEELSATIGETAQYNALTISGTNAGDYTGTLTLKDTTNYKWDNNGGVVTFTITKADNSISGLTISGWTYGNAPNTPSASADFGEIEYTYYDEENNEVTPVSAGTYTVKATVAGTDNYASAEATTTLVIEKQTVTTPTVESKDYTGETLTADVPTSDLYTVTTNNGGINAGTYTVTLTLTDSDNYKWDSANGVTAFTIDKATPTVTASISGWTYDSATSEPTHDTDDYVTSNVWYEYSTSAESGFSATKPTKAGTYYVIAKVTGTDNYHGATSSAVQFTIAKAKISVPELSYTSVSYNGSAQKPTVANGKYAVIYESENSVNVDEYTVTLSLTDTDNYEWSDGTTDDKDLTYSITKADNSISGLTISGWTYGNAPNAPSASADFGEIEYTYYDEGNNEVTPVNAGNYTVKATVAGTDNYYGAEATANFTIAKVKVNAPALPFTTVDYNGREQVPIIAGSPLYSVAYSDASSTNVGAYSVMLTLADINNYEWSNFGSQNTVTLTYNIEKATPTVTIDMSDWTYDVDNANASAPVPTLSEYVSETSVTYIYTKETMMRSLGDNESYELPTQAGYYSVYAVIEGTDNYERVTSDKVYFTIEKATVTTPTVSSKEYTGATLVADVPISDLYSVTTNAGGVNVGDYPVTLSLVDSDNYEWDSANGELTFTITKAQNSISGLAITGWTYGEKANAPSASATFGAPTFTYAIKGSQEYSSATPINAGTYIVKASVAETTNYYGAEATAEFTIAKAKISVPELSYTSVSYNGKDQKPSVATSGLYSVAYPTTSVNVGEYTVTITLTDADNYEWTGEDGAVAELKFTITQADNAISGIALTGWTYGNAPNAPSATATFGTPVFTYSTSADGEFTSATPTNAGTYIVKASVAETTNYKGATATATFTIEKATVTTPTVSSKDYTGSEISVTISESAYYNALTISGTNVGDYTGTLTLKDTNNYKWDSAGGVVTFVITKAQVTAPTLSYSKAYTGAEQKPIVTESDYYSVTYPTTSVNVGSYTITLTLNDTDKYEWSDGTTAVKTLSYTITQATNKISGLALTGWTYGNAPNDPSATATFGTPVFTYSTSADGEFTSTLPVNAGTYFVKATVAGTDNYAGATATATFTIAKATAIAPTLSFTTTVYNGGVQKPTVTGEGYVVTYGDANSVSAGSYTVSVALDSNHAWADGTTTARTLSYSITKATTNSITLTMTGWAYGEVASEPTATATYGAPTFTYAVKGSGNYTSTKPTTAGEYTVKATVADSADYVGAEKTADFTITPYVVTAPTLSNSSYGYNGSYRLPVTAGAKDGYIVTITATPAVTEPGVDAGSYTVTLALNDSTNYVWNDGSTANKTYTYTITKTETYINSLAIENWTYGENPKSPSVNTNLSADDIMFVYSTSADGEFTSAVPTSAGTYYVKAYVLETSNYTSAMTSAVTFRIEKATPVLTAPTYSGTHYENQVNLASDYVTAPTAKWLGNSVVGTWEYKDLTFDSSSQGASSSLSLTFTPSDTANYKTNTITVNISLKAVAYANSTSTYYGTIENALENVVNGNIIVIPDISGKVVIEKDVEIKAGITLILPYGGTATAPTYNTNTTATMAVQTGLNGLILANQVVVEENVTLTVKGTLTIAGVLNGGAGGKAYAGNTGGEYAEIIMKARSSLIVDNGGTVHAYGFIHEDSLYNESTVTVNNGGTLGMPFIMYDFRGGSYMYGVYTKMDSLHTSPFSQFEHRNVTSTVRVNYGGQFNGYANIYAGNQHNATTIKMIGSTDKDFIQLTEGGYVIAKYNTRLADYDVKQETEYCDLKIYGGANMNSLELSLKLIGGSQKISTKNVYFPITWRYHVSLYSGDYTIAQKTKFMPGTVFTVGEDATLNVKELIIYESFIDQASNGSDPLAFYPVDLAPAKFIVNGKVIAEAIGGKVYSEADGAEVTVTSSATLTSHEPKLVEGSSILASMKSYDTITETLELCYGENFIMTGEIGTYYSYLSADGAGGWTKADGAFRILFNTNGGNALGGKTIMGESYTIVESELPIPTRTYYIFAGWYTDEALTASAYGVTITSETTLYAKWTEKQYTLQYMNVLPDGNVEVSGISSVTFTVTTPSLTLPAEVSPDDSYTFMGWYILLEGERITALDVQELLAKAESSNGTATVYAVWAKIKQYTINYVNGENHTFDIETSGTVEINTDGTSTYAPPTVASDGKTSLTSKNTDKSTPIYFVGWYMDAEYTTEYSWDALNALIQNDGALTLYARWEKKNTLTVNKGEIGNVTVSISDKLYFMPTETSYNLPSLSAIETDTSADRYLNNWTYKGTNYNSEDTISITSDAEITMNWAMKYSVKGTTLSNATVTISASGHDNVTAKANTAYWYKNGTTLTFAVTFSGSENKNFEYTAGGDSGSLTENGSKEVPVNGANITFTASSTSGGSCVAKGTIITLADGTQKAVEDLTGEEELLVWNLLTGSYDTAKIVFVDVDAETEYEIIHLYFSDGTDVEVIYEHGFFDVGLGEYVYIDSDNANSFVGHTFIKQGDLEQGTWETVTLDRVVIERKVTVAYSPVTFEHLCYYVDGMLSMPGGIDGLFNIFAVDVQTMSYDSELMAKDIAEHGLFSYEDFGGLIPEEAFYAFNGAYLKVAIGKGMITWEMIAYLAERYVPLM